MIESFEQVRRTTDCPFAKKADVVEIPSSCQTIDSLAAKLSEVLPTLTPRSLDAALVSLPAQYTGSPEAVGQGLYGILEAIDSRCLENVGSDKWRLRLFGEKYFIATFWYGFEDSNPRKCPEGAFLLFQPKSSFERKFRGEEQEARLRRNIRNQFLKNERPYEHETISEAQRFLPEVKWWSKRPNI